MSGRNVTVRVHALQSVNQSLFECVDHYRRLALVQGLVTPGVYHLRMTPPTILNAIRPALPLAEHLEHVLGRPEADPLVEGGWSPARRIAKAWLVYRSQCRLLEGG